MKSDSTRKSTLSKWLLLTAAAMPVLLGTTARAQSSAERTILGGSLKPVAADARSARPKQAAVVRTVLTREELDSELSFEVSLAMRDLSRLRERTAAGEIMDRAKLEADHLPARADFDKVSAWLTSQGFTITRSDSHRLAVFATGTVRKIQEAFQTRFAQVTFEGESSLSIVAAPSVPSSLRGVLSVVGLQPYQRFHSFFHAPKLPELTPATNNQTPYLVSEILGAFDGKSNTLTGQGQTIAIVIDAVPSTADMTKFYSLNSNSQTISNFASRYVTTGTRDTPGGEETLDVEWSSAIAPKAKTYLYCTGTLSFDNTDAAYSAIIDDLGNKARPGLHQLSLSYGADEDALSGSGVIETEEQYFATIAGYGVTTLVSSGDNGAFDGNDNLSVSYPASDPSVTAVGGVTVVLNTSTGVASSITGWSDDGQGDFGNRIGSSGGGYSGAFTKPSWQKGTGVPTANKRCVPDISASADQNEAGLLVLTYQGTQYIGGYANGTSWAAPTWAGLIARINQGRADAGMAPLGLLNPKVYPLLGTNNFRDITVGSNGHAGESDGYSCKAGYDLVTGIGTPKFDTLAAKLTGAAAAMPSITSATTASATEGKAFSYTITASGNPTRFGVVGLPAGLKVNATTGVISGTPTVSGQKTLTLKATNAAGTGQLALTLTIAPTAPVITSADTASGKVGTAFSYRITAIYQPTRYSVLGTPPGLTVNATTGVISGTPTKAGTFHPTLRAINATGTGTETLTITIAAK